MFFGLERRRMIGELRSKPALHATTPIGTDVVVIGKVTPLGPELDAPMSGRPCVAHCSLIYPRGLFRELPPRMIAGCVPFVLERPDGSSVVIESDCALFVFPPLPLPDDARERCVECAIAAGIEPRHRKRATYEEILVIETMRIAVAGRLVSGWADGQPARVAGDAERPIIIGVPF